MRALGARDAARNGSGQQHLVLQDIGGQVPGGVNLSTTHKFISNAGLASAMKAYVDGYHTRQRAGAPVIIAIGTNNDLTVDTAAGRTWAMNVVNPVRAYAARYPQITIAGANDIEPGFRAGVAETRAWLSGYLAGTHAPFVFNGSADGCSWHVPDVGCSNGWHATDLAGLAGALAPSRIVALPQVYNSEMAAQWALISRTAVLHHRPALRIVGPLTENVACGSDPNCPTMPSARAWQLLWQGLGRHHVRPASLPVQIDLDVR
jgi:hypothetical protein